MIRLFTVITLLMCVPISAFGIVHDLLKRENIDDVHLTYTDYETKKFFENKANWGGKGWPDKNPFDDNDVANLKTFLEAFDLLIPIGGNGGASCKSVGYRVDGGKTSNEAKICTVKYEKFGDTWTLTMMVNSYASGNVIEGFSISSGFLVGLSIE